MPTISLGGCVMWMTHSWSCLMGQIDYWTSRLPKQQTPWKTFHHGHWDIHVTLFWTQCHPNITPHVAAVRSLASTAFNISICKDQIFCLIPFYHINRIHKYIVTVVFESGYLLDIITWNSRHSGHFSKCTRSPHSISHVLPGHQYLQKMWSTLGL